MKVTATILPGCTASLELPTPASVLAYMKERPAVLQWEIEGTPEEEAEVANNWLRT